MYKNIFFISLQILFIFFIGFFYLSDENINNISKSRSKNFDDLYTKVTEIPILENDTKDIIEYVSNPINSKKKKKYNKFFELLKNDEK
tara:strand:+ start:836 stop:1099 length:264 start_codon:yes stop_codon:yes gene_type:complete